MTATVRPQPVVDLVKEAADLATRVSAFIKGIGAVLVLVGLVTDVDVTRWAEIAGLVIVAVGELGSYIYTRVQLLRAARAAAAKVTPLSSPQDNRGVHLIPADEAVAIAEVLAEAPPAVVDEPGRHAAREKTA